MPEARWKRLERVTARSLGAERLPNTGRGQPNIVAGPFALEHKARETLPQWPLSAMDQARRPSRMGRTGPGQTPVVVLTMP